LFCGGWKESTNLQVNTDEFLNADVGFILASVFCIQAFQLPTCVKNRGIAS
jgi:hypothetical protein